MHVQFQLPLPDDPKKWDGWSKYKSPNLYERLCLDPKQNPTNEIIEEHCRELLRWWQKKLPLKSQPSNPLTQLLRPGLDESSRYLTQARAELLDPQRRRVLDTELAAQAQEQAIAEFHKFLTFAIADGVLTADGEKNLFRFGREHLLSDEQIRAYIEAELQESGARRAAAAEPAAARPEPARAPRPRRQALSPKDEFIRMLRLTGLDSDGMSDDTRDAFVNMAENLGLDAGEAEDLIDDYLDEVDADSDYNAAPVQRTRVEMPATAPVPVARPAEVAAPVPETAPPSGGAMQENAKLDAFVSSIGTKMLFIPGAEFTMGSEAPDAAPNERPLTKVTLSRFFISKHPITNAQFEQFDATHNRKRAPGAGNQHPVVHVTSLEAIKFCQWLSTRERKKYRLPTEAEWEYAARGTDGRKYPWGNYGGRGDLANFADRNTVFAWSDRDINDGYAESSPVGAYPQGASPFGVEDMAGNVWEWCLDYFEGYRGAPKTNPRGPTAGKTRVYRGGSWKSRFNSLRTTVRSSNVPNYSCNDLGFRIVCECE
ncbi:MAG TPA: formylglycine-generating enzyme family protein [Chthoniobacterales bacterium]|nr:formylglycine-generating enzyme family protein [Chthoniobacterales bacterium]